MSAVERASTFFRRAPGKAFELHESRCETAYRNYQADDVDDMQHVMVAGRATMLLEHVAQTEINAPGEKTRG